jgi:hypothetical protein
MLHNNTTGAALGTVPASPGNSTTLEMDPGTHAAPARPAEGQR